MSDPTQAPAAPLPSAALISSARQKHLVAKYAKGAALKPEQLAEIAHLLPAAQPHGLPVAPAPSVGQAKRLCAFWAVSGRTIATWRNEGAPLNDTSAMLTFLARRKQLTPATRKRIAEVEATAGDRVRPLALRASANEPDAKLGAAAELRRLESEAQSAFAEMQRAKAGRLKPDAAPGDEPFVSEAEVRQTTDRWLKISESLRRYDLMVEQSRRDSGELLPRAEWSRMQRAAVFWFLHSINRAHDELCEKLVGQPDPIAVWRVLDADLINRMGEAFAFACRRESGMALPAWAVKDTMDALLTPLEEQPTPDKIP